MEALISQPLVLVVTAALVGALLTLIVAKAITKSKQEAVDKQENLKVLCWMSQSGRLKIDEEGNKSPRLLHLANMSRFPVFDVMVEFQNEEEKTGGKIYLEALLPHQEEVFPVTEWSNLGRPVFRRARLTGYSFVDYAGQRWARAFTKSKVTFKKVKPLSGKALGIEVRQVRLPEYKDPVLLYLPAPSPPPSTPDEKKTSKFRKS